jgi:hypothetical protein
MDARRTITLAVPPVYPSDVFILLFLEKTKAENICCTCRKGNFRTKEDELSDNNSHNSQLRPPLTAWDIDVRQGIETEVPAS